MSKTKVVNIRVQESILKQLDGLIKQKKYSSRSELIREFLREYVQEQKIKTGDLK